MTSLAGQSLIRHIENGDMQTVVQIIQSSVVHIDERDGDGQTFLMIASQVGKYEITQEILNQPHVEVNAVDNDNWSALLNAAKEGHERIVYILLENGASVDHKDTGGWTALMWSCYKGRTQCAQVLLDHNANPNLKGEHHMSCLTWAAGRGNVEIVRKLLAHGAKVNTVDKYGTTPLIWASRKGYTEIVDMLLHAGASVDNAGMNSWTALLIASKGGYTEVVKILLEYSPNVNSVDKDGYTGLTWAAKDGHVEIVKSLLQYGAYVNLPDRYGDTILIHAVKGGHLEVVKALLKKYADVDVQGVDDKTAIYWAVEKGHINVTRALIEFGVNIEIANKDGDTPLLKAVRSRNYEIVRLMMEKNAKVSASDKRGDTALHVAVRGRSKRIMELLLRNPKDARLLYRPNKDGETPYQIDVTKDKSILTQVFGTRNLNALDNNRGYELYSSTIADVLSEPSLNTPINVGLYAKWGSGKSFLTDQLKRDMTSFVEQQTVPEFFFSLLQGAVCLLLALIVGIVLWLTTNWMIGLGVGLGLLLLQYIILGTLILIVRVKDWDWSYYLSVRLQRKIQLLRLLLLVIFCNQPAPPKRETTNVKFLFTKNARLASVVGEKSITYMIATLSEELENEFGVLATRVYSVFKPKKAEQYGMFKTICCIPYFVITTAVLLCLAAGIIILGFFGVHSFKEPGYTVVDSILIALAIIVTLAIISNIYTWGKMFVNLVMPAKRRINRIGASLESIKTEGFMQSLKKEVELMGHMTNCMDAFLKTHTRLVVIVDGLDSCEQEKLLQVLDTLHMLFGDQGSPFITILAVDPHIIVKGIESNAHVFFRDSSINGHDYLRNMVQLPFFLQVQAMPAKRFIAHNSGVHEGSVGPGETSVKTLVGADNKRMLRQRQDTVISTSSQMSLNEPGLKGKKKHGPLAGSQVLLMKRLSQSDLSRSLGKNSYFSDINPRSMKRMMNIIAVTGRLLRAYGVDFSWYKLAAWINITEQWPYRLSWLILEQEDQEEEIKDTMPLQNLYERVREKLPASKDIEPLLEIDRNVNKLELLLSNQNPVLTVGDMRRFLPCTINVDPYLRKLIRELQQNIENLTSEYNMGINPLLSPKSSDILQNMGNTTVLNKRSRNISGDNTMPRGSAARMMSRSMAASPMPMMMGPSPYMPWMNPAFMQQMMAGAQFPAFQQQTNTLRLRGPKVKMQGGLPLERLSNMSIEGICNLLRRLDGISTQQLPMYQSRLQDNNITGCVLMSCELSELKEVVAMSFGDWELFKRLVEMLREKENTFSKSITSSSDSIDNLQSPEAFCNDVVTTRENPVEIPKPKYAGEMKRSSLASRSGQFSNLSTNEGKGMLAVEEKRRETFHRVDSLYSDVQAETSMIKGMLDMVGIEEDFDEEEENEELERVTVTMDNHIVNVDNHVASAGNHIPLHDQSFEQHNLNPFIDDTTKLVNKIKKKKKKSKKQKSDYESGKSDDFDTRSNKSGLMYSSAYSAGPDDESDTASEKEMKIMKIKEDQSRRRSLSKGSVSTSDPTSPTHPTIEIKPEIHRINSRISASGSTPTTPDESQPFIEGTSNPAHTTVFMPQDGTTVPVVAPSRHSARSDDSSLHLSEDVTPVMSPTSSHEHLMLRTLSLVDQLEGPSAFASVSGTSSRQSSRASSRSGSIKAPRNKTPENVLTPQSSNELDVPKQKHH